MNSRTRSTALPAVAAAIALVTVLGGYAESAAADPLGPTASGTADAIQPGAVVQGYTVVEANRLIAAHRQSSLVATCPAGSKVVGGGGIGGGVIEYVNSSRPLSDGSGWQIYVNNNRTDRPRAYVSAVCATDVANYQIVSGTSVNNPAHAQTRATVRCPEGTVPYGGGGTASSSSLQVNLNSDLPLPGGWRIDVNNDGTGTDTATAVAVCGTRPTGYRQVHSAGFVVGANQQGSDSVRCPDGTTGLGGGGLSDSAATTVNLWSTYPDHDFELDTYDWTADIFNASSSSSTITAYEVCARVSAS